MNPINSPGLTFEVSYFKFNLQFGSTLYISYYCYNLLSFGDLVKHKVHEKCSKFTKIRLILLCDLCGFFENFVFNYL